MYPCLKHHTHVATCISYISETGISNILLCLRGPFRVNSLCSGAIRSSFEAALTHSYWQWGSSKSKLKASVYWWTRGQFWIKFNFFATRVSENQPDCFFSMLEHATVPVRATKFAEVETGLNRAMICINVSKFFTYFQKIGRSTWTQRSKFGWLIPHFGRTLTARVGRCFELCNGMMW